MGVKGFWNYFYACSNLHELLIEHVIGDGSTLLVDGSSFMFFLMNMVSREDGELIDRRYGGSYEEFRRIIRRECTLLLEAGFKLVVFFDGKSSKFKDQVAQTRVTTGSSNWTHFYEVIQYQHTVIEQDSLPLPPLTRIFFELVLRQDFADTIELVHCHGEADVDLGLQCVRRSREGPCYIYSQDSDFAVMRDCASIKFGVFSATHSGRKARDFHVPVWRRQSVCGALGLSEHQLIEFCILLGCDYTASHELHNNFADYRSSLEPPQRDSAAPGPFALEEGTYGLRAFTRLLSALRAQGPNFSLCAVEGNVVLHLAIQYSRAFFNLDTTAMDSLTSELIMANAMQADSEVLGLPPSDQADENDAADAREALLEDSDEGEAEEDFTILVPDELEEQFLDLLNANPPSDVAACATRVLQYFSDLHAGTIPLPAELSLEMLPLQPDHITALQTMMKCMRAPDRVLDEHPHHPMADWETVVAGKVYQDLLYRAIRQHFEFHHIGALEQLYDGRTFYHLYAAQCNKEAEAAQLAYESAVLQQTMLHEAIGRDDCELSDEHSHESEEDTEVDDFNRVLPVCEEPKKSEILSAIWEQRVSIISGKTGCGKSTRLPLMIHEEASKRGEACRILVSEPHRLAAQGLFNRVSGSHPALVSLKLGKHGSKGLIDAPITFATAGYIFHRYVNQLGDLTRYTHVIIDEVHERSVENDLVFLIVKHLLHSDLQVKVVLMSATPHTEVFHQYYALFGPLAMVTVPTHTHTLTRYYLEDLPSSDTSPAFQAIFTRDFELSREELIRKCDKVVSDDAGDNSIPNSFTIKQIDVALGIIRTCPVGTAVLVFVTGMAEINMFEGRLRLQRNVQFVAIHSDLGATHENHVLTSLAPDRIRVIVATNAAESSITLPDVDVVICLGTFNQEQYDSTQIARTVLKNSWISKPSAEQRAGRTARVRPGTAYHLYTRSLHDHVFKARNPPAIVCKPLHDVLVRVLGNLDGFYGFPTVADLLQNLIEPPEISHIQTSLDYLHGAGMITVASIVTCALTGMGRFASRLPMSTHLSRMVSIGISLGVGAFAVILSVVLGRQISRPFRTKHAVYTNADDFNDKVREVFLETVFTDRGTYSEPIMLVRLFCNWYKAGHAGRKAMKAFLDPKKITMLEKEARILQNRVNDVLVQFGNAEIDFEAELDSRHVSGDVITLLQYLLVWSSGGNVLKYAPPAPSDQLSQAEQQKLLFTHSRITPAKINELFPPLKTNGRITEMQRDFLRLSGARVPPTPANPQAGRVTEQNLQSLVAALLTNNAGLQAVWVWSSTSERRMLVIGTQMADHRADLERLLSNAMHVLDVQQARTGSFFTQQSPAGRPVYLHTVHNGDFRTHALELKLHLLFQSSYEVFVSVEERQATASIQIKACNASIFENRLFDTLHDHLGHVVAPTNCYRAPLGTYQQVAFSDVQRKHPTRVSPSQSTQVQDIPLGMRLLNAYCRKCGFAKLNVSTLDAVPGRAPRAWYSISTPKVLDLRGHYAQWSLLSHNASSAVTVTPAVRDAVNAPRMLRTDEYTRVGIDPYSYLHHSVPQLRTAEEVLYAVANTVVVSQRGDRESVLCDQVTMLPYTEAWLTCAMACVDAGWKVYSRPDGKQHVYSTIRHCSGIHRRLMERAQSDVIEYDRDLVDKVFALHRATHSL